MADHQQDGAQATETGEPPSGPADPVLPRRRLWPILLALVVLAGAGGLFIHRQLTAPDPLRILVAVDVNGQWWEGSRAAAQLADELSTMLGDLGFEAVRAGDPQTAEVLEAADSPRAAAEELGAAFVITGRLEPRVTELPVAEGFFEVAFDDQVTVQHVAEPEPFAQARIDTYSGAKDEERASKLAAESAARHILDAAVPAIVAHPEVAELIDGQDPKLIDRLAPTKTYVGARKASLEDAAEAYAELASRRAEREERGPLTFHSPADADDRLCAVGARGLLVATADVRPFYSARGHDLLRSESLASVGWRAIDDEPTPLNDPLWRGYNAFTYPSASREGNRVALIEDMYGWGRSLVLLEEGKPMRRLRTEASRRLSEPRIAPDGRHVALVDRACRGCAKELVVVDADSGEERRRLGESDARFLGRFEWLDSSRLMVVMTRTDGQEGLWAVPIASAREPSSLMLVEGNASLTDPVANADASIVAATNPRRGSIVTLDVASNTVTSHLVAGEATALSFSPDGQRIAFELSTPDRRYHEIATLDIGSSEVRHLTSNDSPDRFPRFSPDGQRVFFEARNTDPVFGRKRAVVRIASVPAR